MSKELGVRNHVADGFRFSFDAVLGYLNQLAEEGLTVPPVVTEFQVEFQKLTSLKDRVLVELETVPLAEDSLSLDGSFRINITPPSDCSFSIPMTNSALLLIKQFRNMGAKSIERIGGMSDGMYRIQIWWGGTELEPDNVIYLHGVTEFDRVSSRTVIKTEYRKLLDTFAQSSGVEFGECRYRPLAQVDQG